MKNTVYLLTILVFSLVACKKDPIDPSIHLPVPPAYQDSLQAYIKQQVNAADYASIDFNRCILSKQGAAWYWMLTQKQSAASTAFLLLQSDSGGHFAKGKWIELSVNPNENGLVNGSINISPLDRAYVTQSKISNGYIEAFHPRLFSNNSKAESLPDPYQELQEVIVVAYRPSAVADISYSTYMLFQSLMSDGGGGAYNSGIYSFTEGSSGGGAGYTDPSTATGTYPSNDITLNIEKSPYLPAINVDAWLQCFQAIPDNGANYSITLCADLPVDDDPSFNVNLYTGATGHTFLQLQKSNAGQSVTQVIGFTAQNAFTALIQADQFVPSKTVDNAGHKYDASLTMHLNGAAFATVMEKIKQLSASMPYSVTRFDCLDYDLAVINAIRGNDPLLLPTVPQPGNAYTMISTGERLYNLLEQKKAAGDSEAANIWLGNGAAVFAGSSHGPCN